MKSICIILTLVLVLPALANDVDTGTLKAYHRFGATSYMEMHKLFEEYSGPVLTLPTRTLTIKVFNDHDQLPFDICRKKKCNGLFHPATNTIWIYGRYWRNKNKIVVREDVLGHELMHWMQYQNKYMLDPDMIYGKNVGGLKVEKKTRVLH